MMRAAQKESQRDKEEKKKKKKKKQKQKLQRNKTSKNNSRVDSWSNSGCGEDLKAVAGLIESDSFSLRGGVIESWGSVPWVSHCVFRTSRRNVIAIVNSGQCKWCQGASSASVQESNFDKFGTRTYLRGVFQLKHSEAVKLSELISELTKTQGDGDSRAFTGIPPYCTVENVTHISGLALRKLLELDKDFVWGYNLTFTTKV